MKVLSGIGIVGVPICLTAGVLFSDVTCVKGVASSGLSDGLIGYWNFDESSGGIVHDLSGNGYNGAVINYPGGQGSWTSGQIGGALEFGGPSTHQYVSVPDFAMPTASMTLTTWAWADSIPRWATIAANWNGAWGAFNYATFGGDPNMSLYVADGGSPPNIVNITYDVSSAEVSLGQWHFMAVEANSVFHTVTFFQDGAITGSFHYDGKLLASSSLLNIGDDPSDPHPDQANWDGKIDDLAIWDRALSFSELKSIYDAGLAGEPLLTPIPEPSVAAMFCPWIFGIGLFRIVKHFTRSESKG
ncbi:MAG TPA: LamG domain-containing protein [Candidatus Limnocylindria bacterium]|jgi:hypothetical protein|nr:LamG domain-containing protein [Candidatus Limnocylindria bacterium]